jgi:phage-related minor tail protein
MKPSVQKISIESDAKKLDSDITKQKNNIDKVFMSYLKAWNEFQSFLDEAQNKTQRLDRDVSDVMDALQELGVDFTKIPDLSSASDIVLRAEDDIKGLRKLYSKPQ